MNDQSCAATIEGVVHEYPAFRLGPVSLTVARGSLCVLVGPNGAGKTTLLWCLLGLMTPTRGDIRIADLSVAGRNPAALREVGFVPDGSTDYLAELSALEVWELHALAHTRIRGAVGTMMDRARVLADRLSFTPPPRPLADYSHGMVKKTQIVAALLHDPLLVVLDEPKNGLDPISMAQLDGVIADCRASGSAVLMATHDLRDAEALADEVAVLNDGALVAYGPPRVLRARDEATLTETFFRLVGDVRR